MISIDELRSDEAARWRARPCGEPMPSLAETAREMARSLIAVLTAMATVWLILAALGITPPG